MAKLMQHLQRLAVAGLLSFALATAPWGIAFAADQDDVIVALETLLDQDAAIRHSAAQNLYRRAVQISPEDEKGRTQFREVLLGYLESMHAMGGWTDEQKTPGNWMEALWIWHEAALAAQEREASRIAREDAQRGVLHALGYVARAEDAVVLLQWGRRMATRDAAMTALGLLPPTETTGFILEALESLPQTTQVQAIQILGNWKAVAAQDALIALAQNTASRPVTWACLEALAKMGGAPTLAYPPQPNYTAEESTRYAELGLLAAQAMMEANPTGAENIFMSFTTLYTKRHQLRAALLGLSALNSSEVSGLALGYLGTPELRSTAMDLLVQDPSEELDAHLVAMVARDNPVQSSTLLEILKLREYEELDSLLEGALASEDAVLRFQAAVLAGQQPAMEDVLAVIRINTPWLQQQALAVLTAPVLPEVEEERSGAIADLRRALLKETMPPSVIKALLGHLKKVGTPTDLLVISELFMDPTLVEAAYDAAGAIIDRYPDDEATHFVRSEMSMVLTKPDMARLPFQPEDIEGGDASAILAQWGYVQDWEVLGAFVNAQHREETTPAQATLLSKLDHLELEGIQYVWKPATASGALALLDFKTIFGPFNEASAFARTTINVPDWTPVVLVLDYDDSIAVWLNAKALKAGDVLSEFQEEALRIRTTLRPGVNRILVRSTQMQGDWRMGLQIQQRDGNPLNLQEQSMPDLGTGDVGVKKDKLKALLENDVP